VHAHIPLNCKSVIHFVSLCVVDLHAERIGHGFHLFTDTPLKSYADALAQYMAAHRITLEVCKIVWLPRVV
jgi:adenosine deaminase